MFSFRKILAKNNIKKMKIFVNNLVAIFWSKQKIQSDGDGD